MQSVTNETLWNVDDGYFIFVFVCKIRISSDEEASKSKLDCGYLRICFTGNTAKKKLTGVSGDQSVISQENFKISHR